MYDFQIICDSTGMHKCNASAMQTQLQVVMKLAHPRYPQPEYDDKVLIVIGHWAPVAPLGRIHSPSPRMFEDQSA